MVILTRPGHVSCCYRNNRISCITATMISISSLITVRVSIITLFPLARGMQPARLALPFP
ncbi:UNVERIFIED_CONTAM: hypothetical protein DQE83_20375 [Escherichia coli]